jgi:hypothetical protein
VVLLAPVAAAADNPPDIVGDTVDQAESTLLAWHQKVIIVWDPDLKQLPPSVSPDSVLVASTTDLPAPDADHPSVEVDLGTALPDLTGLSETEVDAKLNPLDMKAEILPHGRQPGWTASVQRPPAGTIVAFGSTVSVVLAAPLPTPTSEPPPPSPPPRSAPPVPPPRSGFDPRLVAAVGGGSTALLLLVVLVSVSSVRRGRRRRQPAPSQRIEAHGYPGQVVGPTISANAPDLSVRVEPRSDPGTVTVVQEARR